MAMFIESEMALFSECMQRCAQKLLDTADVVRDARFHQLSVFERRMAESTSPDLDRKGL
jgi:hypothetical protein